MNFLRVKTSNLCTVPNPVKTRGLYLLIFLCSTLLFQEVKAQQCSVTADRYKVCVNQTVTYTFAHNFTATPVTYQWLLGDGSSSSSPSPVYKYSVAGTYTASVTVTFSNGQTCQAQSSPVTIFALPNADFRITSASTQCFANNLFCFEDRSTPGSSQAPIQSRVMLFGNGGSNIQPAGNKNICYSYPDTPGGIFSVVMEVMDTNGCIARFEKKDSIRVYPKMKNVEFTIQTEVLCGKTRVRLTNWSDYAESELSSFRWIFGDGTEQSTGWANTEHLYDKSGTKQVTLEVTDKNNCKTTKTYPVLITSVTFDSTFTILPSQTQCYQGNDFGFMLDVSPQVVTTWSIKDEGGNTIVGFTPSPSSLLGTFPTCGRYTIRATQTFGNCTLTIDTFAVVLGPKAVIETPAYRLLSKNQCVIKDTMFFRTPNPELSCFYNNPGIKILWDFKDPFAPPCTTSVANNVNVGANCNFATDTFQVKHFYNPANPGCYTPILKIMDTGTGCEHSDSVKLRLTPPDAHPAPNATPPRRGLYITDKPCLNTTVIFRLDETLPLCGREMGWILKDSMCFPHNWEPISPDLDHHNTFYTGTCDTSGYVTVGLILSNGKDGNNNTCYDTAWYHYMLHFIQIDPVFTYEADATCKPFKVKLTMRDSIQKGIKSVRWSMPSMQTQVFQFGPNDSIIPSVYFTVDQDMQTIAAVTIVDTNDCFWTSAKDLYVGSVSRINISKSIYCTGERVQLTDSTRYYFQTVNNGYNYWKDTSRNEETYIDFGDGSGFSKIESRPVSHVYTDTGFYDITLIALDSIGCPDTTRFVDVFRVLDVETRIKSRDSMPLYCAPQIVYFEDSSYILDPFPALPSSVRDNVISWEWKFNNGYPNSILQQPSQDFSFNGTYPVKLIVKTFYGCIDSAVFDVEIKGPEPSFTIEDTVGCSPFTVKFKNTTIKKLKSWIWYFNDTAQTFFSTDNNGDVTFTYYKPGVYPIRLYGEDTVFNKTTQSYKTCGIMYPDSNIGLPVRQIRVLPIPELHITSKDTVCLNTQVTFATSANYDYKKYLWTLPDGDTVTHFAPDTSLALVFDSTGSYRVKVWSVKTNPLECMDTAVKDVIVKDILAGFEVKVKIGKVYEFTNTSTGAESYTWDFGQPSSGRHNFSDEVNPFHDYGEENDVFLVCLKAFDRFGCEDTACKTVIPVSRIVIPNVFTPNGDDRNDAFDIDIEGQTLYDLVIYNRWGNIVFEGKKDGLANDGINWNGREDNTGSACPDGVYFFIFKYKFAGSDEKFDAHGTVTLLRE